MGKYITDKKLTEQGAGAMLVYGFNINGAYNDSEDDRDTGLEALRVAEQFCKRFGVVPVHLKLDKAYQDFGFPRGSAGFYPGSKPRTHDHMHVLSYEGKAPLIVSHPYVDPEVLKDNNKINTWLNDYHHSFKMLHTKKHDTMLPETLCFAADSWYFPGRTIALIMCSKALYKEMKSGR